LEIATANWPLATADFSLRFALRALQKIDLELFEK
jgi:hypothetical protein